MSDGLVQDLGHLCRESGVAARIEAASVPASAAAYAAGPGWLERRLTGGDDYELLLSVPPDREAALRRAAGGAGIAVTRIGRFEAGAGVTVLDDAGRPMAFRRPGWSHF